MGAPWEDYQNTSDNAAPWEDYAAKNVNTQQPIVAVQPQEESFWGDLKNAGSKFVEGISRPEPSAVRSFSPTIGAALNVAGNAGNLLTNVVGAGIRGAYRALPKTVQEGVSSVGKMIADNPIVDLAKTAYGQIPEDVRNDLGNMAGVANIVPLAMGAKASAPIAKEAINIGQDVANLARWTNPASLDTQIGGIVKSNINKAIRPTVVGKRNATQIQNFYDNANTAVKSIVENKNNLNLSDVDDITHGVPKNLTQFSEAIDQTKKNVFRQYDDMKLAAGEAGAQVDLAPAVKELEGVIKNPVLNDLHPDIVNYAAQRMEALSARGTYTTSEAQDAITHLNKSLESFYKNPSYETANRAGVDAIIVNNIRKSLDNVIENTAGEGYQGLKNTYGALKSIEKEVAHRAIVDARKNAKGLIDLTDIYTSGELVGGLLTMNPAMMTKGGIGIGIRKMHNVLNNPNRYVDKMFSGVDKLMEKEATPVIMKSKIGQKLQGVADRFKKDMPVDNAIDPFDQSGIRPTPIPLPMPERGFSLKGIPYGDDSIVARSTTTPIRGLPYPQSEPLKQLPPGQGFTVKDVDYGIPVGKPYGEPGFIDVPSTSRPIKGLPAPEQPLALPPGQGFQFSNPQMVNEPTKRLSLEIMRDQLQSGTAGIIKDGEGGFKRYSSHAPWFRDIASKHDVAAKDIISVINKALDNKSLTGKQTMIWKDIRKAAEVEEYQNPIIRDYQNMLNKQWELAGESHNFNEVADYFDNLKQQR